MNQTLETLGFISLEDFIKEKMNLIVEGKGIFIKCTSEVPKLSIVPAHRKSDILSVSLERCEENNQLAAGYNKKQKEWYSINTSRNLLKSKKWSKIFDVLGFDYSVFILINSVIVEKVGENFVLICGEQGSLNLRKEQTFQVQKETLFLGKCKNLTVDTSKAISEILKEEIGRENFEKLSQIIEKVFSKYNNLPINSIFRNFFKIELSSINHEDEIIKSAQNKKITNFLFLISKKFLKPVFTRKHFTILKGKIALLMERNIYETLSCDDLLSYFSTKNFKLFEGLNINNDQKSRIILYFMLFIFNSIYLKIISLHFYSTPTSHSKRKIYYFVRNHWNIRTTRFCSEYLENFEKVGPTNKSVGTLRFIPKNSGFRVITNCSSQSSYRHNLMNNEIKKENKKNLKTNLNFVNKEINKVEKKNSELTFSKLADKYEDFGEILVYQTDKNKFKSKNHEHKDFEETDSKIPIELLANKYEDINEILCQSNFQNKISATVSKNRKHLNYKLSSINFKASPLLPILKTAFSKNTGFSVLRHSHIKHKIYNFLKSKNQRLFLLKVDLKQCFENIPQDDVLSIINDLLSEDHYFYQELQIFTSKDSNSKFDKFCIRRSPEVPIPLNMAEAQPSASEFPHNIKDGFIIKEIKSKIFNKDQVMKILTDIVNNTVIKYQNGYYRRKVGISQGCTISSILCAIYYAYLDRNFRDLNCFISRYVDDFLIITDDFSNIQKFLEIAETLKDQGFVINQSKIHSNVDLLDPAKYKSNFIEWCGLKVFDQKIAIKSEFDHSFFRYMVSIHYSKRGQKIFEYLKKIFKMKFSLILINMNNTKTGENIFDGFFFICRKLKILISRASFINRNFIKAILNYFRNELDRILEERRILFDSVKIERILENVFNKTGILDLHNRKFER